MESELCWSLKFLASLNRRVFDNVGMGAGKVSCQTPGPQNANTRLIRIPTK